MASRGPGPVAAVHRILIVTALLGALVYALWELRAARAGAGGSVLRAGLVFAVAVGIGAYLRSLRGLGAKLTPRDETHRSPR